MMEIFYMEGSAIKKGSIENLFKLRRKRLWINTIAIIPKAINFPKLFA